MIVLGTILALFVAIYAFYFYKWKSIKKKSIQSIIKENGKLVIGFFHPYCDTCGGGERVLWSLILSFIDINPKFEYIIYTKCDSSRVKLLKILEKSANTFDLPRLMDENVQKKINLVQLTSCKLLNPSLYPRFTLILQSTGSLFVSIEAFFRKEVDFFIDTTGFTFTLPIFKGLSLIWFNKITLEQKKTISYVHYPTISRDMLDLVTKRSSNFNNDKRIASSEFLSSFKVKYYKLFAKLYGLCGFFSDITLVNSTWTKNHIDKLWKINSLLVYPPCNVNKDSKILNQKRELRIVSLGQFRPEKNHNLQIEIFIKIVEICKEKNLKLPEFLLIGGCRGNDDYKRVSELKEKVKNYGKEIENLIKFEINLNFNDLQKKLKNSLIGLHTMKNEHFGIAPVEMQSQGVIVVAHDSGGPKFDIIEHGKSGFLAREKEDFVKEIMNILTMSDEERNIIQKNSFESSQRFSDDTFKKVFTNIIKGD